MYACREDSPWSNFGVCHRAPENWLPHAGHASLRPGNRRSGAHTKTLGCTTRLHTSSCERPSPPALRLCVCKSSALRVGSAGCTQGTPASSTRPSSMRRVTSSTAFFTQATLRSATAAASDDRSAAVGTGAPLVAVTQRFSSECCVLLGLAGCGREPPCSMSRTESWRGSRWPAGAPGVAAPALP